jgi:5-(carboxyamino)imidazole ribonucleotide synthase
MIEPGRVIGVLGGGQLGRMLGLAARRMGYGFQVYTDDPASPGAQIADLAVTGDYADADRVAEFARSVDVLTFEFENVAAACAEAAARVTLVRPHGEVLHITQNRIREKTFLRDVAGVPVTPFQAVHTPADLADFPYPAILKTAESGYDGKGQKRVADLTAAEAAWIELGQVPCVLEEIIAFEREVSVVAARNAAGKFVHFGVIENSHANHILDVSRGPVSYDVDAIEIARIVLEKLGVIGVLCVEMFELPGGRLLVNELAPRTHNSGHLTIEACDISQFEAQLRAICDLPLPAPVYRQGGAAMANLLGDLWPCNWRGALEMGVWLHLYGKRDALPGRKMGHLTAIGETPDEAAALVTQARERVICK